MKCARENNSSFSGFQDSTIRLLQQFSSSSSSSMFLEQKYLTAEIDLG